MDIFISYERSDRPRAAELAKALEGEGWSVWWDRKLSGGERFNRIIQQQLDEAACVIVLWSTTSIESDWVRDEAVDGLKRSVLVPVRIDDVRVPLGFRQLHTIDLIGSDPGASQTGLDELFASVRRVLQSPDTSLSSSDRRGPSRQRRVPIVAITALAGVLAVGTAAFFYYRQTPPKDQRAEPANVGDTSPRTRSEPCRVSLATPAENATLLEHTVATGASEDGTWVFGWRGCPEASRYHLYVIGPGALNPIVNDDSLTKATYAYRQHGRASRLEGWTWKVRAYADNQWGQWSEVRTFDIARAASSQDSRSGGARAPAGQPDSRDTQVLRSAVDTVSRGRMASEAPGLAVFEIPYVFDRAHTRPMYVRVRIYGEAEAAQPGQRPRRPLIGEGQARVTSSSGTVNVDVRKRLGVAARSSFIEAALLEEGISLAVQQWPDTRLWGP